MKCHCLIRIYLETGIFEIKKERSQRSDGLQIGWHLISSATCMSIHGPLTINKLCNLGEFQNTIFSSQRNSPNCNDN